jgi:hypothetical protein
MEKFTVDRKTDSKHALQSVKQRHLKTQIHCAVWLQALGPEASHTKI